MAQFGFYGGSPSTQRPDDYGTPAYSALAGAGFGFTPDIYGRKPHERWSLSGPKPRGPKGYRRSDNRIREDICENLMMDNAIDASDVSVSVVDGKVALEGTVPERHMKHAIEDLADSLGAADIDNRIRVARR